MDNQEIIINQIIKKILFNDKSRLEAKHSTIQKGLDTISRQAAIDALFELYEYQRDIDPTEAADLVRQGIYLAEKKIEQLPSAQPEPLLDEIVDEIRKTIAETESNGKYHADPVRHNGEMICHGLQIALNIIEEKRNERSD